MKKYYTLIAIILFVKRKQYYSIHTAEYQPEIIISIIIQKEAITLS